MMVPSTGSTPPPRLSVSSSASELEGLAVDGPVGLAPTLAEAGAEAGAGATTSGTGWTADEGVVAPGADEITSVSSPPNTLLITDLKIMQIPKTYSTTKGT